MSDRVLVAGTFDLLHLGHFRYLERCADMGNVTIALSTDKNTHPKRKPILSYAERRASLLMLPWVARIVAKDEHSFKPLILQEEPHVVTYGSDWAKFEWLRMNGINLVYLDELGIDLVKVYNDNTISTTAIIARINSARDTT